MKYTYLLLLFSTLLFPLLFTFDNRIGFYKRLPSLMISIVTVAAFFISWDVFFTREGIWSFNNKYVSGLYIFGLPIEEWMFFFIVPYSCVFIYDSIKYFFNHDFLAKRLRAITFLIIFVLTFLAVYFSGKTYTCVTFSLTAAFLLFHYLVFNKKYLGRFYFAYLIHLIPFFIINGFLTSLPVVIYNNQENIGLRIFTVPIEDSIYSMLLLLMNISIYEFLNSRAFTFKKVNLFKERA